MKTIILYTIKIFILALFISITLGSCCLSKQTIEISDVNFPEDAYPPEDVLDCMFFRELTEQVFLLDVDSILSNKSAVICAIKCSNTIVLRQKNDWFYKRFNRKFMKKIYPLIKEKYEWVLSVFDGIYIKELEINIGGIISEQSDSYRLFNCPQENP